MEREHAAGREQAGDGLSQNVTPVKEAFGMFATVGWQAIAT